MDVTFTRAPKLAYQVVRDRGTWKYWRSEWDRACASEYPSSLEVGALMDLLPTQVHMPNFTDMAGTVFTIKSPFILMGSKFRVFYIEDLAMMKCVLHCGGDHEGKLTLRSQIMD